MTTVISIPSPPSAPISWCGWRSSSCTILTVVVAHSDFGALNTPIALAIAITKASLVIIMFMGLRYNTPLTKVVAISGFLWLMILFCVGMGDYLTRDWLHVAGR